MRLISDEALLVVTIYQEAAGEPFIGKVAVAEVMLRRADLRYQSDGTIAGTVLRPYQFSGWNARSANRIMSVQIDDTDEVVRDCERALTVARTHPGITKGAVIYFNASAADANFVQHVRATCTHTVTLGRHEFYAEIAQAA